MNVNINSILPNFKPKIIFDIGFGLIDNNKYNYEDKDVMFHFFEPNILFFRDLQINFKNYNNIKLYNNAIYNENKIVNFYLDGFGSFIDGVFSYIKFSLKDKTELFLDSYKIKINTYKISEFDNGDIDFLSLNCEGCEWYVLESLISRPKIIRINYITESGYSNPFMGNIINWLKENNYETRFSHMPADSYHDIYYILN